MGSGNGSAVDDGFAQRLEELAGASGSQRARPKPNGSPVRPSPDTDQFGGRLGQAVEDISGPPSGGMQGDAGSTENTPAEGELNAQPAGTGEHVVRQGECIASIAKDKGHFWETIWSDAGNTELREARKDPYVLLPGDRVHVPPLRQKWEPGQTEMRHRFKRKGWPEVLRIRVLSDGEPRRNEPYTLVIDAREFSGTTDADGRLSCPIVPNARKAVLSVGAEPDIGRYVLTLGGVDPIESISGVQKRLNNLGFDCGEVDGICGPRTEAALREYQRRRRLLITGEPDAATRKQLQADFGC